MFYDRAVRMGLKEFAFLCFFSLLKVHFWALWLNAQWNDSCVIKWDCVLQKDDTVGGLSTIHKRKKKSLFYDILTSHTSHYVSPPVISDTVVFKGENIHNSLVLSWPLLSIKNKDKNKSE